MSREREYIDPVLAHSDGNMPAALRAVAKQQYVFGQSLPYLSYRRRRARHVGGGRDRDEAGVGSEQFYNIVCTYVPLRQLAYVVVDRARLFQPFERPQDGIVFHTGGDRVIAFFQRTEKGDIQRLRAVFGKDNAVEPVPVEELVERVSAILNDPRAGERKLMTAPSGICTYFDSGAHGGEYAVGFSAAGRGIVEIDHKCTSFFTIYIKYSIPKKRSV